jgi:hypothetical protein
MWRLKSEMRCVVCVACVMCRVLAGRRGVRAYGAAVDLAQFVYHPQYGGVPARARGPLSVVRRWAFSLFSERSGLTSVRVLGPARHQKQLRSIQAIVGASLPIYTQAGLTGVAVADGPLSNIIREMVEQNELVVGYRARRKRGSRASKDPVLAFVSVPITPLRTRIGLIPFSPHTPHTTHRTRHTPHNTRHTHTPHTHTHTCTEKGQGHQSQQTRSGLHPHGPAAPGAITGPLHQCSRNRPPRCAFTVMLMKLRLTHDTQRSSWSERRKKHTLGLWRPVVYSSGRSVLPSPPNITRSA